MVEPEPEADTEAPMLVHDKGVAQFISRQVELPFQAIRTTAYGRVYASKAFQYSVAPVRPPCHQFVEQPVVKLVVAVLYRGFRVDKDGAFIHLVRFHILHCYLLVAGSDGNAITHGCRKHGECPSRVKEEVVGLLLWAVGINGHSHTVHRIGHHGHMAARRYPHAVYALHLLVKDAHGQVLCRRGARGKQDDCCQKCFFHIRGNYFVVE